MKMELCFRKCSKILFLFLAGTMMFCRPVLAEDFQLEAVIDRNVVPLGAYLQLTVTASGSQSLAPLQIPDIDGMQTRYLGASTHMSILNGQYSKSISFSYNLFPTKVGTFQIPALAVSYEGKDYSTEPISFQVVDDKSGGASASSEETALKDKIFLVMHLPKRTFYENEKIPLTIKLLINGLKVQNIHYPTFEQSGFMEDDFMNPAENSEVIGGVRYQTYEFRKYIYPTRTGDINLGPAKLICDILFKGPDSGKRSGGMDSFFSDSFFDSFFETYDSRSVTLESVDMKISVLPLPEEGKPDGFSKAVGRFGFEMTVSPTDIKEGDPVTVRMQITGNGNLKNITPPALELSGAVKKNFKLYDPQISDQDGKKVIEQVVIPKNPGVNEFPAVSFSYFDTDQKRYVTMARGPFPLHVTKLEAGEQMKVVGLAPEDAAAVPRNEVFGRDISYIKRNIGHLQPIGYRLHRTFFFNFLQWTAIFFWIGAVGLFRFTHKIRTDEQFAKKLRAPRNARAGLVKAKGHLDKKEQKEFYDVLFKTLQAYLCSKFHIASGAVSYETVEEIIRSKGLTGSIYGNIKAVFEECEMIRYASVDLNHEKMRETYHRSEKIIDFLERNTR